MKVGYARVSTDEQSLDLQINALRNAGCTRIFSDYGVSGKGFDREGLEEALSGVKPGGMFVVWRLDRLGRSLPRLIHFVDELGQRGAEFHSLTENIDTSSPGGRLIFHIMGALAEFERALISERTRAGMEAARLKGQHIGRRPSLDADDIMEVTEAIKSGEPVKLVAQRYGVTCRTITKYLCGLDAK